MLVQDAIEQGNDVMLTTSLTQLHGLFSHIEGVTKRYIGDQTTQSAYAVQYLSESFESFAYIYFMAFNRGLEADAALTPERRSYLRYKAVQRLSRDWEELSRIIAAVSDPRIAVLEVLVREAQPSLSWATEYVAYEEQKDPSRPASRPPAHMPSRFITIPYFGRHFELLSFRYAPDIFVTGVPLYNLESPWDWHVVWHEMAGHVVNLLEQKQEIEQHILPRLEKLHYWDVWRAGYERVAAGGAQPVAEAENDVGTNNPVLAHQEHVEGPLSWDAIQPKDWVAEVLEDAYGILALGPAMYTSLERVLRQNYEDDFELSDTRHPPLRLRLDMAAAILLTRLAAERHHPTLAKLGFDAQRIAACEALAPIAAVLAETLCGSQSRPGYVRAPFDPDEMTLAEELRDQLLGNLPLVPTATIPALISAAHLAFVERPQAALRISTAIQAALTQLPIPDVGRQLFRMPSHGELQVLVEGMSWQRLQDASFSTIDAASPLDHPATQNVWLEWRAHDRRHGFWHTSKQHLA